MTNIITLTSLFMDSTNRQACSAPSVHQLQSLLAERLCIRLLCLASKRRKVFNVTEEKAKGFGIFTNIDFMG